VAGSSAKLSSGSLDHPAMVVSLYRLGSMVIDIDRNQLVAHFLDDNGTSRDDFTILKSATMDVPGPPPASRARTELALRAHPNPFTRAGARFEFVLPGPGRATLSIYRVDGARIARLVDQDLPAGSQSFVWDGRDSQGRPIAPGVYYATLRSGGDTRVESLVRLQ
jgi:hypothetical protein